MFSDYLDLVVGSDSADKCSSSRLWLAKTGNWWGSHVAGPEVFLPVLESLNRKLQLDFFSTAR